VKSQRISLDFSDHPAIVETLRRVAVHEGKTQKEIVLRALEAYFSHQLEQTMMLEHGKHVFAEWDNEDDRVYDTL